MKALRDWTIDDIRALKGRQENDILDVKSDLDGGSASDPWHSGGKLSDNAKDDIIKGVVAFANHDGGLLLIGVEESKAEGDVDRVGDPKPIRACEELAKVIQDTLADIIDPPLAGVLARGIRIAPDKDEGVVAIEVRSSPSAPHWNKRKRAAHIRRGHKSDPMTMREIQDLTILRERGAAALEERFAKAAADARGLQLSGLGSWILDVTAIPVSQMSLPDSRSDPSLVPEFREFLLRVGGDVTARVPVDRGAQIRRRVRGVSRLYVRESHKRASISAFRDGSINAMLQFRLQHPAGKHFFATANWFLAAFASVLDHAERTRNSSTGPGSVPYAVQAILRTEGPITFYPLMDYDHVDSSEFETASVVFPRYEFGDVASLSETALLFMADLYDLAGRSEVPTGTLTRIS